MIYYILVVAAGLITLFLLALLATQFWRLGQYLKWKHPILFRIYAAFWVFIGLCISIGVFSLASSQIEQNKNQEKQNKLNSDEARASATLRDCRTTPPRSNDPKMPKIENYDTLDSWENDLYAYNMKEAIKCLQTTVVH